MLAGKRGEAAAYKLIAERVASGERAYVVCPKVEDDPRRRYRLERRDDGRREIAAALPSRASGSCTVGSTARSAIA